MCVLVVGNSSNNSGTSDKSTNTGGIAGGVSGAGVLVLIITIVGIIIELLRRANILCPQKSSGNWIVVLTCN